MTRLEGVDRSAINRWEEPDRDAGERRRTAAHVREVADQQASCQTDERVLVLDIKTRGHSIVADLAELGLRRIVALKPRLLPRTRG